MYGKKKRKCFFGSKNLLYKLQWKSKKTFPEVPVLHHIGLHNNDNHDNNW